MTAFLPPHPPANPRWEIRLLHAPEEIQAAEVLQRDVWPGGDLEIVPAHVLLTAAHNGGLLAGAYVEDTLVGFVWGFPGLDMTADPPRLKHCSHQLGILPGFRGSGIGFALKCYQRDFVLRQGLDRITWTYDPLLARNARLNIARLGAVCNTYLVNLYGELRDDLNAGLPTDRFQVDWWITEERVANRLASSASQPGSLADRLASGATLLNPPGPDGAPRPPAPSVAAPATAAAMLLEIPPDFLALKAANPALALRWRIATRQVFGALFGQGYAVTDFMSQVGPVPRAVYVLTHKNRAR